MTSVTANMTQRLKDGFMRFLIWREHHIKEKNFVLLLAFAVGILGGLAALVLKFLIHSISGLLTAHVNIASGNYLYILLPAAGVIISALYVRYIVRDDISHGVTRVLYAISQNKSRLKRHNIYTSVLASSVTIGFGGSVGAEGPIVFTGAAIGSNLGAAFRMSPRILMAAEPRQVSQASSRLPSQACFSPSRYSCSTSPRFQ